LVNPDEKRDSTQHYLANERTFLAWVRTCVALIGLGFIISKFSILVAEFRGITFTQSASPNNTLSTSSYYADTQLAPLLGSGLIVFSICLIILALYNYQKIRRSLETGIYKSNSGLPYILGTIIILVSLLTIVYLLLIN
jgi:putative membrane protein